MVAALQPKVIASPHGSGTRVTVFTSPTNRAVVRRECSYGWLYLADYLDQISSIRSSQRTKELLRLVSTLTA